MTTAGNREQEFHRRHQEMAVAIGHILRRTVGLPAEDDPFIERSDESALPSLGVVASSIVVAGYGPGVFGRKPRAVETDLEALRRKLGKVRKQIAALDSEVRSAINRAGSDENRYLRELIKTQPANIDEIIRAQRAAETVPREQWTVPAALTAIERLENATVPVIEHAVEASTQLSHTGRPRGGAKGRVTVIVARYIRDVTGNAPKVPDRPWEESDDSFAVALREIFAILGLPPGIQRAAEYATSKL